MEHKGSDSGNAKLGFLRNMLIPGKWTKFYGQFSYAAVLHCRVGHCPILGKIFLLFNPLITGGNETLYILQQTWS